MNYQITRKIIDLEKMKDSCLLPLLIKLSCLVSFALKLRFFTHSASLRVKIISSIMDNLPRDVLLMIIKKITVFEAENLLWFETAFPFYQELTREKAVLRALPRICLWYLTDHSLSERKRKLTCQISHSGHKTYNVASAAHMLQQDNPTLEKIKLILREAAAHGSDSAKYFDLMLKALVKDGFSMNDVLPVFMDLFNRKQLVGCGRAVTNVDDIPFFWGRYWTRSLPPSLERRFTCNSKGTCKGHGKRPNIFWPLPGDDEEYSTTN